MRKPQTQTEDLAAELLREIREKAGESVSDPSGKRLAKVHVGLEKKTMRMQSDVSLLEKRLRASLDSTQMAVTEVRQLKEVAAKS